MTCTTSDKTHDDAARTSNLSIARKNALNALHIKRVIATAAALSGAIDRMERGATNVLRPPFKWTLKSLASEASRDVATIQSYNPATGKRRYILELTRFKEAGRARGLSMTRDSPPKCLNKAENIEAEARLKDELARQVLRNIELARRLKALREVQDNYTATKDSNRELQQEVQELKFRLFEAEARLRGDLANISSA